MRAFGTFVAALGGRVAPFLGLAVGTIGEQSHPASRGCAASVYLVVTSVLSGGTSKTLEEVNQFGGCQMGSFSKGKLRAEP